MNKKINNHLKLKYKKILIKLHLQIFYFYQIDKIYIYLKYVYIFKSFILNIIHNILINYFNICI